MSLSREGLIGLAVIWLWLRSVTIIGGAQASNEAPGSQCSSSGGGHGDAPTCKPYLGSVDRDEGR